jgi:hypothetical protein
VLRVRLEVDAGAVAGVERAAGVLALPLEAHLVRVAGVAAAPAILRILLEGDADVATEYQIALTGSAALSLGAGSLEPRRFRANVATASTVFWISLGVNAGRPSAEFGPRRAGKVAFPCGADRQEALGGEALGLAAPAVLRIREEVGEGLARTFADDLPLLTGDLSAGPRAAGVGATAARVAPAAASLRTAASTASGASCSGCCDELFTTTGRPPKKKQHPQ